MRSTRKSPSAKTSKAKSSSKPRAAARSAPRKKQKAQPVVKLVAKNATGKRLARGAESPIVHVVMRALDDMKAVNVRTLDVREQTDIADTMIIASGNSDRHVRAIADRVLEFAKKEGFRPMGIEGERDGEWVLVDLQDVIVHVMLPRVREFYRLESLWDVSEARRKVSSEW